jgi:hypothetical protein
LFTGVLPLRHGAVDVANVLKLCLPSSYQVNSNAKFSGPVENLICEMDQMFCCHRQVSAARIRGQVNQPFGQGKRAYEGMW